VRRKRRAWISKRSLLAVYAFAVFGYVTASLATFFVGRDAANPHAELAGADEVEALRLEVAALRRDLRDFRSRAGGGAGGPPSDATA
jgi:hypothetical protein